MNLKDKRLVEHFELSDQEKYMKDISGLLPDGQNKLEECEITHKPINLLKRIKQKPPNESKKE
jgi:hypothetical protein